MRYLLLTTLLAACSVSWARPVSYPGGYTAMQMNNPDLSSLHLHYTPDRSYSVGYKGAYWKEQSFQSHHLHVNYLAKRWNEPEWQTNIYLKAGVGLAHRDSDGFDNVTRPAGSFGFAFDRESRRWFMSYENHMHSAGKIDRMFMQQARVGVAPYLGSYGDIHTWLMLQLEHEPEDDKEVRLTPLIRLFKGRYLVEIGGNDDGILFNWIIRK